VQKTEMHYVYLIT